jgi:hypothetical protein
MKDKSDTLSEAMMKLLRMTYKEMASSYNKNNLQKQRPKKDTESNRPIAKLCSSSKIFEKIIQIYFSHIQEEARVAPGDSKEIAVRQHCLYH